MSGGGGYVLPPQRAAPWWPYLESDSRWSYRREQLPGGYTVESGSPVAIPATRDGSPVAIPSRAAARWLDSGVGSQVDGPRVGYMIVGPRGGIYDSWTAGWDL